MTEANHTTRALLISPVTPNPIGNGLARRAWLWAVTLASQHRLEIMVFAAYPEPEPTWPLPGSLTRAPLTAQPLRPRALVDWFYPGQSITDVFSQLTGPIPERIIIFRFYLHDLAALLPTDWRTRAEIDCDDWEAGTRLSLAALALRRGHVKLAVTRCIEAWRYALLERKLLQS